MDERTVQIYQSMISKVARRYGRHIDGMEITDFEQEMWVWLLEFLKYTPDVDIISIQDSLALEAKRRMQHNKVNPPDEVPQGLRNKVNAAWEEYIATLGFPERTIMTCTKLNHKPDEIAEKLDMSRHEVCTTKYQLIQNFKIFLRRYFERS